jgi:hypothetical protein
MSWRWHLFVLATDLGIHSDVMFDEESVGGHDFLTVTMPKSTSQYVVTYSDAGFRVEGAGLNRSWSCATIGDAARKLLELYAADKQ